MLSSGLLCLLEHPDQLAALRPDPGLISGAVEEILRYQNPLHYFRRTATADTAVRGQEIKRGEKLGMIYTSANRDEDVFDRPFEFDIRRSPNEHVGFGGGGPHFCLGASLAKMEIKVGMEELLRRAPDYTVSADRVERMPSETNRTFSTLPFVPSGRVGAAVG
jgi:cytochrome P450